VVISAMLADLASARGPDELHRQAVVQRASRVLRPPGALARLDQVAAWLAGWQRTDVPAVEAPVLVLAAGDHGVVQRGVTSFPQEVTTAIVDAIKAGAATSAVMAAQLGVALRLVDAGVGSPTADIVVDDALSIERFAHLVDLGRRTVREVRADIVAVGEMGIGNTTASAAVAAGLLGGDPATFVGPGAGLDCDGLARKREAVAAAVERVGKASPLEVLRRLGGAEHAVLAGVIAESRVRSIPVLLDGFVTSVVAAALDGAVEGATDHCLASHLSPEPGHRLVLDRLGLEPLLDLGMRLGEGSGALVALPIVRLAAAAVVDVVTFDEWGLR
jgi:nicotinate-nucleotide--dimethylbenzimidazole phosphoribosyltransferase